MKRYRLTALLTLALLLLAAVLCACDDGDTRVTYEVVAETAMGAPTPAQAKDEAISFAIELETTIAPTGIPTFTPTPSPIPTATPTIAPTPFTIAWISDTQAYALGRPDPINAMADWLLENRIKENIVCIVHTGDVSDNGASTWQWDYINPPFERLLKEYPILFTAGNHDVTESGSIRYFLKQPPIAASIPDGQAFTDSAGSWATFSAGGRDFILVSLYWNADYNSYKQAVEVLSSHMDSVGIIVTHSALESDGSLTGPGTRVMRKVAELCPNVRLVLCGHMRGSVRRTDFIDDDGDGSYERKVVTMMYNFQDDREKGLGHLRLLRFDPASGDIHVQTYSPYYDDYSYQEDENLDDFVIAKGF